VNAGGAIATSYGYEPFGATAASGAASSNSHRFTGRELDPTGLYYLRHRYYNPMLGRFLSPDPAGIAGGINLYAYAGNDPLDFSDPLGLKGGSGGGPVPCEACLHGPPIPRTQGPVARFLVPMPAVSPTPAPTPIPYAYPPTRLGSIPSGTSGALMRPRPQMPESVL